MKCGRLRCKTPKDNVLQAQGVTLCETHRLVQAITHILEQLQRMPRAWPRSER